MSRLVARLHRLATMTRAAYTETGSVRHAAAFATRFVRAKAPLLLLHVRQSWPGASAPRRRAREASQASGQPLLAVKIGGGVGDYLVAARFLRDLLAAVEPCQVFLYANAPERAVWLCGALPGYQAVYADSLFDLDAPAYDLALTVNSLAAVYPTRITAALRAALRAAPRLLAVRATLWRHQQPLTAYITHHPRLDNGLARYAVVTGHTRRDFLHYCAGLSYGGDLYPVPRTPHRVASVRGRPYITIHNGFDQHFIISGQTATKCYPHFEAVVAGLKRVFPDILVVQVGVHTSERLPSVDLDVLNQTTLREAADLIAGAVLHIDNEGGFVHLARALGVQSAVVYGPTPSAYFGYPGNIALDPPVCGDCWWLTESWMSRCLRGHKHPPCLADQPPEVVTARIITVLRAVLGATEDIPKVVGEAR